VRLFLEFLETRQLLSASGADLGQLMAIPDLTATPQVYRAAPSGLSAGQVRQAYAVNQIGFGGSVAGDGSGQTIAIVVAYDDPNIGADLKQFDRQNGLPDAPSFVKYVQSSLTQVDPGWSLESALDVEWAHAMAPRANIALVEAKSASLNDLFGAVNYARSLSGVVAVEMSWGTGEFYGQNAYDGLFTTPAGHIGGSGLPGDVTFVAASGDSGAWSGTMYPATSPNVLSVGGTTLRLGANSSYSSEQGWYGSTGGFSVLESAPSYQVGAQAATGLSYGLRTTPDVAMVGDPATGLSVYSTVPYGGQSGWFTVGGTSAAAPLWAGLVAVADQGLAMAGKGSLANAQAALYSIPSSAFHQVTSGFNGYSAGSGYNLVTGLGSPIANRVVAGLLATQNVYNVAGFPAPNLTSRQLVNARITVTTSDDTSGSSSSGSTSSTPSLIFPPNIVIVVTPIGAGRVVIILPVINNPTPTIASTNRPVQHLLTTPNILTTASQDTFNRFGQTIPEDSPYFRRLRSISDAQLADLIDVVEPFLPGSPVQPLDNAAAPAAARATAMRPVRRGPAFLSRFELGGTLKELGKAAMKALHGIAPPPDSSGDAAGEPAWMSSTLAGAAAVAGGGYWLALRDGDRGREEPRRGERDDRRFKPGMRRS
jgi:hypothetical protein